MKKIIIFAAALLFLTGCTTSVDALKTNPRKYAGQTVRVRGNVDSSFTIPFTDYTVFILNDTTGRIAVFTLKDKVKNTTTAFEAYIVAIDGEEAGDSASEGVVALENYLLEKGVMEEGDETIEIIVKAINKIAGAFEGTYFLIEKDDK